MRPLVAALVAALLFLAAPPSVAAQRTWSFLIVPGVALGPVQLEMSYSRALSAMPERPERIETEELYNPETGTISTKAIVKWGRVKSQGEGLLNVFIAADFQDGRMKSVWGNDDRLAYRGKNIADLRLADFLAALGPPDQINPLSYAMYSVVWKAKGLVVGFLNEDDGDHVFQVGVFRPNQFEDF